MEKHIRSVAILNVLLGVLGLLFAILYLLFNGGFGGILGIKPHQSGIDFRTLPLETFFEIGMILYFLVLSPLLLIAGLGLTKWQEWARLMTIALSAVNMANLPIGTAVGIYSLWTLLSAEAEPLFEEPPHTRVG